MPSNAEKAEDSGPEARDELEIKKEVEEVHKDKQNGADVSSNDETVRSRRGHRGGRRRNIRNFSEDQPKQEKPLLAKGLKGTVAWYSVRDCYGFIKRDDGEKDVFVHQMAIIKSHMRQLRYRSLAEDEPVEFDLAEGRNGRFEAVNVTGPEGRNVSGTSIVVRKLGNFGPRRVMGIDEDYGGYHQAYGQQRRSQFRRSRAKPDNQGETVVEKSDIEVKEAKNVEVKEASPQKANRPPRGGRRNNNRNRRRTRNSDDPKKDDKVESKEGGDQKKTNGDQNVRRSWRRNAQKNSEKEPRQRSDSTVAQSSSQSNTKSAKTSESKQEPSSSTAAVSSASGDIVQKRIAQWQRVTDKTKNEEQKA